jgi:2-polyprenyl-3-methyl-5-hydroxy-6-metoxy-1,4-benzoquinol methylase
MGFDFGSVDALDYDELRPRRARGRPLGGRTRGLGARSTVVDLAAGTGRLSSPFASLGFRVIAVEPVANMRSVLETNAPT